VSCSPIADSSQRPYRRIASLRESDEFVDYLARLGVTLGFDRKLLAGDGAPLNQSYQCGEFRIGNRFCILPMEGWDGTDDGRPSELTTRRWRRFGESGAKLIWGGEAVAVQHNGRANPNQLLLSDATISSASSPSTTRLIAATAAGNRANLVQRSVCLAKNCASFAKTGAPTSSLRTTTR
jgi:hypothetical protein